MYFEFLELIICNNTYISHDSYFIKLYEKITFRYRHSFINNDSRKDCIEIDQTGIYKIILQISVAYIPNDNLIKCALYVKRNSEKNFNILDSSIYFIKLLLESLSTGDKIILKSNSETLVQLNIDAWLVQ
jgi:hypothetical protein